MRELPASLLPVMFRPTFSGWTLTRRALQAPSRCLEDPDAARAGAVDAPGIVRIEHEAAEAQPEPAALVPPGRSGVAAAEDLARCRGPDHAWNWGQGERLDGLPVEPDLPPGSPGIRALPHALVNAEEAAAHPHVDRAGIPRVHGDRARLPARQLRQAGVHGAPGGCAAGVAEDAHLVEDRAGSRHTGPGAHGVKD